eukprot:CAMPEP_0202920214 /NCGR_PEP_ID=MMETSP1392-20130828/76741_1 /ASSEMBLY_ACC=CAM_ASM_000868 /TAXON_ID=225041 /ORGANISM="Chlamydomonas chlamydogama, Strain SAG 11-48b" /LENGTH=227 /DNA_ID=CAMNT_0049613701 /DNA_START=265 /DNA_END=948 /DNA_ORIENTATION=+
MSDVHGKSPRMGKFNSPRRHPYERDNGSKNMQVDDDEDVPEFETPKNSIKVSATTDVRDLAHTITQACREGDPPALLTIGNNSINQAVKGIAVARAELLKDSNIDLTFQPAFRHVNRTRPLIAFYLAKQRPSRYEERQEEAQLAVAAGSKIISVAGAIAGRVREHKRVVLTAIGVDAVTNAVLASGNARLFLEQDNLDIKVQPEFTKLDKNGQTVNALRFAFVAESI